jgi:hypothetical protein
MRTDQILLISTSVMMHVSPHHSQTKPQTLDLLQGDTALELR